MYGFEVEPIFRGASYMDGAAMVSLFDGGAMPFTSADGLTWRIFPTEPGRAYATGYGYGWGWDYGFVTDAGPSLDQLACMTLMLGSGIAIGSDGAAYWLLASGQTMALRAGAHRMTLDLDRAGQTIRLLDTSISVMN